MTSPSPIAALLLDAGAAFQPYGSPERGLSVAMVITDVQLEYAALRKGCAVIDLPHHGSIIASGQERLGFLNGMITQDVGAMGSGQLRRSFWLNRKGRIDADLRLAELGDRTLIAADALVAAATADALNEFVFAEDAVLEDASERLHRVALHGPRAGDLLTAASDTDRAIAPEPDHAATTTIAGAEVVVEREDSAGELGLVLTVPADAARAVYERLFEAGGERCFERLTGPGDPAAPERNPHAFGLRPIGWMAYNIARIEAGWPLFNIDFDDQCLPAETGVLHDRVSFTKGCYLGQEVVARMQSLGRPKQVLRGLRAADSAAHLPVEGARLFAQPEAEQPVGVVTSSAVSPMLGATPVCLARVKTPNADPGGTLYADLGGAARTPLLVADQLAAWPPASGRGVPGGDATPSEGQRRQ